MTLGTLAAFMAYQARVVAPVQALMGLYGALATARVSWRRVAELLDAPAGGDRAPPTPCRSVEVRGDIEFDEVSLVASARRAGARRRQLPRGRRAPRSPSSARAAAASPRSPIWPCGCWIRMPASSGSTVTTCERCALADLRRARAGRRAGAGAVSRDRSRRTSGTRVRMRADARDRRGARGAPASPASSPGCPKAVRTVVGDRGLALSAGERQRARARARVSGQPVGADSRRAQRRARSRSRSGRSSTGIAA